MLYHLPEKLRTSNTGNKTIDLFSSLSGRVDYLSVNLIGTSMGDIYLKYSK